MPLCLFRHAAQAGATRPLPHCCLPSRSSLPLVLSPCAVGAAVGRGSERARRVPDWHCELPLCSAWGLLPPSMSESTGLARVDPSGEEVMGQDGGEGAAAAHRLIHSLSSVRWQASHAAGVLPADRQARRPCLCRSTAGLGRGSFFLVVSGDLWFPSLPSQADAHFSLLFTCRLVSGFPSTTPILLLPLGS